MRCQKGWRSPSCLELIVGARDTGALVFQDRRILELDLLDVIGEIERDQGLDGSSTKQLLLQEFNGLPRPRAHGIGICVIHNLPEV
jgi:hypothetical protein